MIIFFSQYIEQSIGKQVVCTNSKMLLMYMNGREKRPNILMTNFFIYKRIDAH